MEFLGVGPLELLFIFLIALIILGPNDMVKAGRTLGRMMRKVVTSPTWHAVQETSRNLRYLPNQLMRDAGLEEEMQKLNQVTTDINASIGDLGKSISASPGNATGEAIQSKEGLSAWTTPPAESSPTPTQPEEKDAASAEIPSESEASTPEPPQP